MPVIDYSKFLERLDSDSMLPLRNAMPALIEKNLNIDRFGDLFKWLDAFKTLPNITPASIDLNQNTIRIGKQDDTDVATLKLLKQQLKKLHPWRKGPFDVFGIHIDTEWRSDLKWDRLKNKIESLEGKTVLDVGCGSGYHCWRMRGAGAAIVVGIEPTPLFIVQFEAMQKYIQDFSVHVLPARLEELPTKLQCFDTVFSMGILYHRQSPFDHLQELLDALKPGGQLILETLVIDDKQGNVLVPEGRYSKMGNIWFIPSPSTLQVWLKKMGFINVECIDITKTTTDEQRSTEWMNFQSLKDFLDPADANLTIEGYPAPLRAVFIANKFIANKFTANKSA